jgi:hypothetical protein
LLRQQRYAPGYIGWVAQNPTGLQVGLALRHDPQQVRPPDIDGFLDHVRDVVGIPPSARPRPPAPAWSRAAGRMGRSPANA